MINARMKVGKLNGPLKCGGTTTLSVWDGPNGRETDSGEKLVVTDWVMSGEESIREGANAVAMHSPFDGDWYIVAVECP